MRGRELGLSGQDLLLYQTGEVMQIGVMIEKSLEKWIDDAWIWQGTPKADRIMPMAYKAKVKLAKKLAEVYPWSPTHLDHIRGAMEASLTSMQRRNRVVHDQWIAFPEQPGTITRFGYFPESAPGAGDAMEISPGIGPGQFTNEEWEDLRTDLWHSWWRLSHLTWVQPDYDGTFFFGNTEQHFEFVRGEFDLSRDSMTLWSQRGAR